MENWRLLIRICLNVYVARDVPMMQSMRLLKFHPYIYRGESPKSMKFPMDSSSVTQLFPLLLFLSIPVSVGRQRRRSYGGRLSEFSATVCRLWILGVRTRHLCGPTRCLGREA